MIKSFQHSFYIVSLLKHDRSESLVILIPKITSTSPMSFISKLEDKNDLVSFTISKFVPNISMSSTYKHMITPTLSLNLV